MNSKRYATYECLPYGFRRRIAELAIDDPSKWVVEKIPALGHKSFMDIVNEKNGHEKAAQFLCKIEGKF